MRTGTKHLIASLLLLTPFLVECSCLNAQKNEGGTAQQQAFTAKERHRIKFAPVTSSLVFGPDGTLLVATDKNGRIIIWDVITGKEKYLFNEKFGVPRAVFSPDGKYLAAGLGQGKDGPLKMWELPSGREIFSVNAAGDLAFRRGGKEFVTCTTEAIQIRDAKNGELIREFKFDPPFSGGYQKPVFSADGKTAAVYFFVGKMVKTWSVDSGEEKATLKGHERAVSSLCFNTSLTQIATTSDDKILWIWKALDGYLLHKIRFERTPIKAAFSPDEKWLAVGFGGQTKGIAILDAASGKEVASIETEIGPAWALAFNPQGTMLATAISHDIQVWDLSVPKAAAK